MVIVLIAIAAVVIAVGVAIKKHGSLKAAEASAVREAGLIEAEAVKLEGEAKTALTAVVARLRAI
ncbi:MAG: hypothetical protein WAU89_13485 [Candidatus Acidiferrales bacterium]